ncbi:MAG: methionyl-tRNA formyltransferase [Proteobacteria bacterium]|nr:methionyl-tRNA formyltransferase [Pseudomonadota bacterium]
MTDKKLRLAFAGTPELAKIVLESLIQANEHIVQLVFTQPDRPAGRGRKLKQSEVKYYALQNNLPVLQPSTSKELDPESLNDCDLLLVVAYGLLIKQNILSKPEFGCINIHTSLLPRWRGAAPIQRAIEAGDKETGISFMQMDSGLDTGPVLKQISCPIKDKDTAGSLHDRLANIAANNINQLLSKIKNQELIATQQDDALANYANKISKDDAELDWNKSAIELERKVRAFNPFPVTHTILNGIKMRIWEASIKPVPGNNNLIPGTVLKNKRNLDVITGEGILSIAQLQLPGKQVVSASDFLNGHPDFIS